MSIIHKTYRFAIEPSKEQTVLIDKHFGCTRFIYNHFLNERKEQYQASKKSDGYHQQSASLTKLKKQEGTIWLKEVNSQSLQFALRCLDTAYINFFKGQAQFPRFKSKRNKNSFTVPQFASIENGHLFIPKFKQGIKVNVHRKIKGKIGKCTITRTAAGKYFVSIHAEEHHEPLSKTGKTVGIDLGLKDFLITSDGNKLRNHKWTKRYEKQLKQAQQHLSRKQKGSKSRERQASKAARIHEKLSNSRRDILHKISHSLVRDHDIICLEDLNVKKMVHNRKLSKAILDASWGEFIRMLEYKAQWNNKLIVKVDRFYPSSKTCHECGWINQSLELKDRKWTCANGHEIDRDINAAKNILQEGMNKISAGTVDHTDGDGVRPRKRQSSEKSGVLSSI